LALVGAAAPVELVEQHLQVHLVLPGMVEMVFKTA
jgi:hypothetical protein